MSGSFKQYGKIKAVRLLPGFLVGVFSLSLFMPIPSTYVHDFREPNLSIPLAIATAKPENIVHNWLPVSKAVDATTTQASDKLVFPKIAVVIPKLIPAVKEAHLLIPSLKLNAVIKDVGMTPLGAMAVPNNNFDVGWFSMGTRPGETGSAVIGGHNRWDSADGVFGDLNQLRKGDVLSIVSAAGVSISFVVREMRTYDPTDDGTDIFQSDAGIHLNLITCSGVWDAKTKSYSKRLVIFTDLDPVNPVIQP